MRIFVKYFSLVSKACTDLSELKNRLGVRSFSGQLSFRYQGVNFNSIFIPICICIWFDWKEKDNKQSEIEYYVEKWNKTLTSFAGSW